MLSSCDANARKVFWERFFFGKGFLVAVLHNYPSPFQYGAEKINNNNTFKIAWPKIRIIREVHLNNICPLVCTVLCWCDNLDSSVPALKSSIFSAVSQRNLSLVVFSLWILISFAFFSVWIAVTSLIWVAIVIDILFVLVIILISLSVLITLIRIFWNKGNNNSSMQVLNTTHNTQRSAPGNKTSNVVWFYVQVSPKNPESGKLRWVIDQKKRAWCLKLHG